MLTVKRDNKNGNKQMQLDALTPQQQQLVDPFWLSLQAAPYDEEPVTPEEEVAVEAARESIRRGEPLIPHEEIMREFGLE